MARELERLTALQVRRLGRGRYADGGNLYLHVSPDGRYWFFRWGAGGKNYLSIGPVHTVSLARAREKARAARELLLDGRDPKAELIAQRLAARLKAAQQVTFGEAADRYFEAHRRKWRSDKHAREWRATLAAYAEPVLGRLPVDTIDTALVLKALEPVWTTKTITAGRVRQRIETVLDFAKARGLRNGDNPARWRGHLDHLLPAPRQVARVQHHAALPYRDVPRFMARLRTQSNAAAHCLAFLILTACRTNEARLAKWAEITGDTWVIPANRMKAGREHRVPLSSAARGSLERGAGDHAGFVFRGRNSDRPFGVVALGKLVKQLSGDAALTVHGFRSAFRDWAAEQTTFPDHVVEQALAPIHQHGDRSRVFAVRFARATPAAAGRVGALLFRGAYDLRGADARASSWLKQKPPVAVAAVNVAKPTRPAGFGGCGQSRRRQKPISRNFRRSLNRATILPCSLQSTCACARQCQCRCRWCKRSAIGSMSGFAIRRKLSIRLSRWKDRSNNTSLN